MKFKPKHALAAVAIAIAGQAGAQTISAVPADGNSSYYFVALDEIAGRSYFTELVANAGSTTSGVLHLDDLISNPTGVYLDTKNHELWVASFGNHTAAAYNPTANGDAAPIRIIRSAPANRPVPGMGNPHPIAYDSKREEILVPN